MSHQLKIRGIYATALTKVLLDSGFTVVDPSREIQERFQLKSSRKTPQILIKDRQDLQGIEIFGEADHLTPLIRFIQEIFLDAALVEFSPAAEFQEESEETRDLSRVGIEFGGASKEVLDGIRSSVAPTLAKHHRLRIVHPQKLEKAEKQLLQSPQRREELEKKVFLETILLPLQKSGLVKLEHVKISGKPIRPREGALVGIDGLKIIVKRFFTQGRYDGLDLPIEKGDYGLTEVQEGSWYIKHSYYSSTGKLKGEYYNINTPVELYPTGARYLDLELDLIRPWEKKPFLVDRDSLALLAQKGMIGIKLEKKALEAAEDLQKRLGIEGEK